jgi:uncharacterized membrane protein
VSTQASALPRPVREALRRFTRPVNVSPGERAVSIAAGAALVALGLTRRRKIPGIGLVMTGAGLFWRGATGHCDIYALLGIDRSTERAIRAQASVSVDRPADELYRFWRNLENLPKVFPHLIAVAEIDRRRSRWAAEAPGGALVEWEAEIVAERKGEALAWRTVGESDVDHRGSVRFSPAPGGRGTLVSVALEYVAPGGPSGMAVAKLLGKDPERQIRKDLRRFRQLAEAGEIPTTEGRPAGPR